MSNVLRKDSAKKPGKGSPIKKKVRLSSKKRSSIDKHTESQKSMNRRSIDSNPIEIVLEQNNYQESQERLPKIINDKYLSNLPPKISQLSQSGKVKRDSMPSMDYTDMLRMDKQQSNVSG